MPADAPLAETFVTQRRASSILALLLFTLLAGWIQSPVLRHPGGAIYVGAAVPNSPTLRLLAGAGPLTVRDAQDATWWGMFGLGDTLRGIYTLTWWAHVVLDGAHQGSHYDATTLFPTPRALVYSDLQLGVAPWFTAAYAVTRDPVLSYQLTMLGGVILCAFGFFLLLRSWTGSILGGLVAGAVVIVAPYQHAFASLLYLNFIPYLPLALLCVDQVIIGERRWMAAMGLLLAVTLQSASSGYLAFTTFILVGLHALVALSRTDAKGRLQATGILVVATAPSAVAMALLYRPFAEQVASGAYGDHQAQQLYNPMMLLLWQFPWLNLKQNFLGTVGAPFLFLALLGVLPFGRRPVTGALVVLTGALLTLGPALTLGPLSIPLPWAWLTHLVPGFGLQRHPYLTVTLTAVGLTILAGHGAASLVNRASLHRGWRVLAAVLAGCALLTYRAPLSARNVLAIAGPSQVPEAYRWLAAHGAGEPLLELPSGTPFNGVYQYFSVYHWLPLFNGTYSYPPRGYEALSKAANSVLGEEDGAAAFLRVVPVRWLLVHGNLLPQEDRAAAWLATPPPRVVPSGRFGDDYVFRIER